VIVMGRSWDYKRTRRAMLAASRDDRNVNASRL